MESVNILFSNVEYKEAGLGAWTVPTTMILQVNTIWLLVLHTLFMYKKVGQYPPS